MTFDATQTRVTLTTARHPGAVAVLHLHGADVRPALETITGRRTWEPGRVYLADVCGIDRGLAVLIPAGSADMAQLMPHGGPRVVQLILDRLTAIGIAHESEPDAMALYPEADAPIQAEALMMVARAASPSAIDHLLAQPALWCEAIKSSRGIDRERIERDTRVLDRLVEPPMVVVAGRPNVGKSTLTNRLLGRSVSLVADLPGTTRDWVGAMVGLVHGPSNLAVRWLDTPGLRDSGDAVEQRAIGLARRVLLEADVLIAMRDLDQDWPEAGALPREPDIRVVNKVDQASDEAAWPGALTISARTGRGLATFQQRIVESLGLARISDPTLWAFSSTLQRFVRGEDEALTDYLGGS